MLPDESLHPELDEMYPAGLPIARIASLVGARVGTVHRHLEGRRRADPTLAVVRAEKPRGPGPAWLRRLAELREFIAKHGRYPAIHGTGEGEARLYGWLAGQRHALVAQTLGWAKARELGVLGDWVTTDRERGNDTHWRQRLGDVAGFAAGQGRLPRHRTANSGLEHVLGIWLQTQNQDVLHEHMVPWRLEALNEALPTGWRKPR